jgi:hypothetical protein
MKDLRFQALETKRQAAAVLAAAFTFLPISVLSSCMALPLPGYGGVIYLPQGRVDLPREASLQACATAVRKAAASGSPAAAGKFQAAGPASQTGGLAANVLGVCSAPDGGRHLVLLDDIQPGLQGQAER